MQVVGTMLCVAVSGQVAGDRLSLWSDRHTNAKLIIARGTSQHHASTTVQGDECQEMSDAAGQDDLPMPICCT